MACRSGTAAAPVLLVLLVLGGCAGRSPEFRWPTAEQTGRAAVSAATAPATWMPLAGAAVLSIGELDEDLSDWGADHAPLFGSDAESTSDDLRRVARGAWLVTALAAPDRQLGDKAGRLAVGASALLLEDVVTDAVKDASGRTRPDASDDKSFSSGHAGTASAAAALARHNLDGLRLPGWVDGTLRVGLHGIALSTGWARVEARKHYVTDVLVGYSVGQFVATFMAEAFLAPGDRSVQVSYHAVPRGGAVTVLRRF